MKKAIVLFSTLLILSACSTRSADTDSTAPPATAVASPRAENANATEAITQKLPEQSPETTIPASASVSALPATDMPSVQLEVHENICIQGTYEDDVGNSAYFSYRLPEIDAPDTESVQTVNRELQQIYEELISPEQANMQQGCSLYTYYVSYRSMTFKDASSILIWAKNDWGCNSFYVYNLDVNGNAMTKTQLLSAVGLTEESFDELVYARLERFVSSGISGEITPDSPPGRTLSRDNILAAQPVLMAEDGSLAFVARVYSYAGADYYDRLFLLVPEQGIPGASIGMLSQTYYEFQTGYAPQCFDVHSEAEGYAIQLFDGLQDHNSTCDWYYLDKTGQGTNVTGNPVDITVW